MRGKLLCIEGIDGAGKSTLVQLIISEMEKRGCTATKFAFPNRTSETGKVLDSVLKSHTKLPPQAVHLLFTANRWENQEAMREALERYDYVLLDRYIASGIAYSVGCNALSLDWCANVEKELIQPDLTVHLSLPVDVSLKRLSSRNAEIFENFEMLSKVKDAYGKLKKTDVAGPWFTVDATCDKETLAAKTLEKILSLKSQQ